MTAPAPRVVARIFALAAIVGGAAAVTTLLLPDLTSSTRPAPWWVLPLVAVAFAVAEKAVFHFEFRREAISFSLSEVPTAFALVYLAPGPAIAARILGSLAVISFQWRKRYFKLFFNAAVFALEMAIAYQIVRLAVGRWPESSVALLVAIVPATALATIVGSLLFSIAIASVEGNIRERLVGELRVSARMAPVNALAAAAAVAPTLISPWLVLLSAAPLIAFWGLMQSYGRLEQRFRDLDDLHGFVGRVGHSLDLDEVMTAAVNDIASLLRVQPRRGRRVRLRPSAAQQASASRCPNCPTSPTTCAGPTCSVRAARSCSTSTTARRWGSPASPRSAACCARRSATARAWSASSWSPSASGAQDHFRRTDVERLQTLVRADRAQPAQGAAAPPHRVRGTPRRAHRPSQPLVVRAHRGRRTGQRPRARPRRRAGRRHDDGPRPVQGSQRHARPPRRRRRAQRLRTAHQAALLGPDDVLARLAGDEFALLAFRDLEAMHQLADAAGRRSPPAVRHRRARRGGHDEHRCGARHR